MKRDLLEELAALAREQQAPPAGEVRLDALMRGELDPQEDLRLREKMSTSARRRAAYEASRPFERATRDRFVERAKREIQAKSDVDFAMAQHPSQRDAQGSDGEGRVVAISSKRRAQVVAAAGMLLAAAALVLLLLRPAAHDGLPAYDFRVMGGEQLVRTHPADDATLPVLGPGSALQLLLRPLVPVDGSVRARVFMAGDGAVVAGRVVNAVQVEQLDVVPEISAEGAIRIDVSEETIARHAKDTIVWLIVAVAEPATLPASASELAGAAQKGDVQIFSRRIQLRGP